MRFLLAAIIVAFSASNAMADFDVVNNKSAFMELVRGKKLTRPLVELQVTTDGRIEGTGARWDVTGNWTWRDGYFCRDLFWGGDALGYNCQEVQANGSRMRFTSDRGNGRSAVFKLR